MIDGRRRDVGPAAPEPLVVRGSPRRGWWRERGDGLIVRLAAPEREREVQRARLSLLGVALACIAAIRSRE